IALFAFFMSGFHFSLNDNVIFSQYLIHALLIPFYIFHLKKIYIHNYTIKLLFCILLLSLFFMFLNQSFEFGFILRFILLVHVFIIVSFIFTGETVSSIFDKYVNVCFFVSLLSLIFAIVFFVTGLNISEYFSGITYKEYGRILGVAGVSAEPAYFATCLMPAALYSLVFIFEKGKLNFKFIVILLCFLLTTSSLAFLSIFIALGIVTFNLLRTKPHFIPLVLPTIGFITLVLFNTEFFQLRFYDTLSVISDFDLSSSDGLNISTYALAVNTSIATNFTFDNLGVGEGFGLYYLVFDEYIINYDIPGYRDSLPGRGSATSLLLRVTVELGLIATMYLMYYLLSNLITKRVTKNEKLKYINWSLFCSFIAIYLRMGEYFINLIPFFFILYILSMEESKSNE
ncbi:hypothetical protein LCGC14_1516190, partial [marine sediment metagenome]